MKSIFTIFTLLLSVHFGIQAQNIITVDNSVGADAQFSDLQNAIDAATSGDILYVHPSETSYGNVTIDKSLTVIGYGHSNPLKNTQIEGIVIEDNASNSRFSGIWVTDEINCENSNTQLQNLIFENSLIDDLDFGSFTSSEGANNVLIRGNVLTVVSGFSTNMIITNNVILDRVIVDENFNSVEVRNNVFLLGNGSPVPMTNNSSSLGSITVQNSIFFDSSDFVEGNINAPGVLYDHCLTYNQGDENIALANGTNNLDNINPLFINVDDLIFDADIDDYRLQNTSPAIDAGAGGVDIGLYDNAGFDFGNFGFTQGVPSVTITAITSQIVQGGTLDITIESNSN